MVLFVSLLTVLSVGTLGTAAAGEKAGAAEESAVVLLDHPDTTTPDSEFEITVETEASAGTVLEVDPDGFDVELSTDEDDSVRVADERIEFLDVSAGASTYTITADIDGGTDSDTAEIAAWVDAEEQADADTEAVDSVEIIALGEDNDSSMGDTGSGTSPPTGDNEQTPPSTDDDDGEADATSPDNSPPESADQDRDESPSADGDRPTSTSGEEAEETTDVTPGFDIPVAIGTIVVLILSVLPERVALKRSDL